MIKKLITILILLTTLTLRADTENCPTSVTYNSTSKRFTFYYKNGIPGPGILYNRLKIEVSKGQGSQYSFVMVNILSKTDTTLITNNAGDSLDGTSEMLSTQSSNGKWTHKDILTYYYNNTDLNANNTIRHCYYYGALPVKISYLTVKNSISGIVIDWTTESEINNYGFDIERSIDGITFEKIGFVKGSGTTYRTTKYTFTDVSSLNGGNYYYYRLKQNDYNGQYEYSNIKFIKNNINKIYPVPFINEININRKNCIIEVYDTSGNKIIESKESTISTEELVPGVYIILIHDIINGDIDKIKIYKLCY